MVALILLRTGLPDAVILGDGLSQRRGPAGAEVAVDVGVGGRDGVQGCCSQRHGRVGRRHRVPGGGNRRRNRRAIDGDRQGPGRRRPRRRVRNRSG